MSSLEVTHALDGFASYYAVSEETEPGDGWDYGPWLKAMTDEPTMSPAQVARSIADSYMDYFMTQNCNIGFLMLQDVTFSVLDAAKASELYDVEFASLDDSGSTITYYGKDEYLTFGDDGTLSVDFDGEWVYLDNLPLALDVVSATDDFVTYRSKVSVDGVTKYLEFTFDRDTEELSITGARDALTSMFGGEALTINVFASTRTLNELPEGATIRPIYEVYDLGSELMSEKESEESVTFQKGTKLSLKSLSDGYYLATAVITDIRGDEYYSPVMSYEISGGKITNRAVDESFRGTSW